MVAAIIIKMKLLSLHFALFSWILGYQQLLEPYSPHYFASSDPPLTFSVTSEQLCTSLYVDTYALTIWVIFHALPSAPQEFLSVQTVPGSSWMQTMQNSDGSMTINLYTCMNSYPLQMTGLSTNVWLHVGMSIGVQLALASVITWAGVQTVQSQAISFAFPILKAALNEITLGGSNPVVGKMEMVDVRYYTSELTAADLVTVAGCEYCFVENSGLVPMPSMESCQFYQIVSRNTVLAVSEETKLYSFPYARVDTSYSATQWMWFSEVFHTEWRGIFRLTQTSNNFGTAGDRIMYVYIRKLSNPHILRLSFDTSTAVDQTLPDLILPVRAM